MRKLVFETTHIIYLSDRYHSELLLGHEIVLIMKSILTILALAGTFQVPYQDTYVAPLTPKEYAMEIVVATWNVEEWQAFEELIHRESSWNNLAQNPKSSAFGYGQFLDSTWETVGCVKSEVPEVQIDCTIKYIQKRYDTPSKALTFQIRNNWY